MLVAGEIDALLSPDLIRPLTRATSASAGCFRTTRRRRSPSIVRPASSRSCTSSASSRRSSSGIPGWPTNLYKAFEQSKALAMERMENPRIVPLAWYREGWEEQERILGKDPWEYGLGGAQCQEFRDGSSTYSHEQGVIKRRLPLDELFLNVSEGRKTRRIQDLAFRSSSVPFVKQYREGSMRRLGAALFALAAGLILAVSGIGGRMAVAASSHRQYLCAWRRRRHPRPHRRRPSLERVQPAVLRRDACRRGRRDRRADRREFGARRLQLRHHHAVADHHRAVHQSEDRLRSVEGSDPFGYIAGIADRCSS